MSMYGTRDAAANWAAEYGATLLAAGYLQGKSSPCIFHHPHNKTTIMVHGDDFVGVGRPEQLIEIREALEKKYRLKVELLSGDKSDVQEVRILNKVVRWTDVGIELEADPRHAEIVVRELGLLEGGAISKCPGVKAAKVEEGAKEAIEFDREEARRYRAIAARLNYLAPDRLDIGYSVKEAARNMSKPMDADWAKLKRIGRYLLWRPRLVSKFAWQRPVSMVTTYADSDWAGCAATAKSTSGGIVTVGSHVLKSFSRQQRTVALSSAEAELHAMVAASAETIGVVALMADMGMTVEGEVFSDSSAALGIAQRQGMGKLRHVRTQALWVQEVRAEGRLKYRKVLGSRNPADALTKYMPSPLMDQHVATVGLEFRGGRADSAPTLDSVETYTEGLVWKRVRFHGTVSVQHIESVGKGRRVNGREKTKWAADAKLMGDDEGNIHETKGEIGDDLGRSKDGGLRGERR